jgi:hypothetical protein
VRYDDFGTTVFSFDPQTNELYAASARGLLTGSNGSIEGTIAVSAIIFTTKVNWGSGSCATGTAHASGHMATLGKYA